MCEKKLNILEAFEILREHPSWCTYNIRNFGIYKYHKITQEESRVIAEHALKYGATFGRQVHVPEVGGERLDCDFNPHTQISVIDRKFKDSITLKELREYEWEIIESEPLRLHEVLRELNNGNGVTIIFPSWKNGFKATVSTVLEFASHIESRKQDKYDVLAGYFFKQF